MKRALVAFLLVAACGRTQTDVQRDRAKSLYPPELGKADGPPPESRTLRARVYADEDHQNMVIGWQVRFYRQMQRANRVLEQQLKVTIEIESARPWPRKRGISNLSAALFDLSNLDDGKDVDFVIGLTTPLPAVSASIHELGMARLFGKHMVLRGMDDAEEFSALSRVLGKLDQDDWERLYNARVRHKEAVVLLHEIGHALGAIHVRDKQLFMHPAATQYAAFYSNENARIMLAAVEGRGDGRRDGDFTVAMIAALKEAKSPRFVTGERERLLAILGAPERLAKADDGAFAPEARDPNAPESVIPPPPPDPVDQARALAAKGELDAAWLLMAPALAGEAPSARTLSTACDVSMRRAPKSDETLRVCERAVESWPEVSGPKMLLGFVLSQRGERERAIELLLESETFLQKDEDATIESWVFLAEVYRAVAAVTLAERAAARAAEDERAQSVLAWAKKVRTVYGLSTDLKISPVAEGAYLKGRGAIQTALADAQFDEADDRAAALAEKFPNLPTADLSLCETYVRLKRFKRAEYACHRVLSRDKKSSEAHALLGVVSFQKGRVRKATSHLERAIEYDPDKADLWSLLNAAYRAMGRGRKARALAQRFEERFGRPLR